MTIQEESGLIEEIPGNSKGTNMSAAAAVAIGTASGLLSGLIGKILETGWLHAVPALQSLLSALQFSSYQGFVKENTGTEGATGDGYDEWLNSLLLVISTISSEKVHYQELAKEYNVPVDKIANSIAGRILENVGPTGVEPFFNIKSFVSADLLREKLTRELGAGKPSGPGPKF